MEVVVGAVNDTDVVLLVDVEVELNMGVLIITDGIELWDSEATEVPAKALAEVDEVADAVLIIIVGVGAPLSPYNVVVIVKMLIVNTVI